MKIAIIGANGLVGKTFIKVIEEYKINATSFILYGSKRSAGTLVEINQKNYEIIELTKESVEKVDYALFSAGANISLEYAPLFANLGAVVIDNSSAYRQNLEVPLIIPEINGHLVAKYQGIIANPNCSTIQAVLALHYINQISKIKTINYTTYQSVSGSGIEGINDLNNTRIGKEPKNYPYSIAHNVIPHIDQFINNEMTKEEYKMIFETQKILDQKIDINALCVRVPVEKCHMVVVDFELEDQVSIDQIEASLKNKPGIKLMNDNLNLNYPINEKAQNQNDVLVGRIRQLKPKNRYSFICVADNIRKGAAANAVQILNYIEGVKNV